MASYPNYDAAMAPIRGNTYTLGQTPKNSTEAIAYGAYMVASAVNRVHGEARSKQVADTYAANQFRASGRSMTQILAEAINTIGVDGTVKSRGTAEIGNLTGMIGNLQKSATPPAATTSGIPDGYYVDKSGYYFYVTKANVLIIGGPGGSINKNVAAGTETYTKIVATLAKEGKVVNAGTAQASGRQPAPAAPPPVASLPAVADSPAAPTGFLDRLTSDPLGAIMALAMNPWVIGGTAVVAAGLVYLAVNKGKSAPSLPVKANRGRKRRKAVEVVEMEEGDEDIEVEEDEVEEEKPNKRRRSSKRRRSGKKAR
jgi:hypothetical protein